MGAVGADREQELEQELVARLVDVAERRTPVLGTHHAELAGAIAEDERPARVADGSVVRALGVVVAHAGGPAPAELVLEVAVAADGSLRPDHFLPLAPRELAARQEVRVDRASQRLPAQ